MGTAKAGDKDLSLGCDLPVMPSHFLSVLNLRFIAMLQDYSWAPSSAISGIICCPIYETRVPEHPLPGSLTSKGPGSASLCGVSSLDLVHDRGTPIPNLAYWAPWGLVPPRSLCPHTCGPGLSASVTPDPTAYLVPLLPTAQFSPPTSNPQGFRSQGPIKGAAAQEIQSVPPSGLSQPCSHPPSRQHLPCLPCTNAPT